MTFGEAEDGPFVDKGAPDRGLLSVLSNCKRSEEVIEGGRGRVAGVGAVELDTTGAESLDSTFENLKPNSSPTVPKSSVKRLDSFLLGVVVFSKSNASPAEEIFENCDAGSVVEPNCPNESSKP
jgi:hypothetical protein